LANVIIGSFVDLPPEVMNFLQLSHAPPAFDDDIAI